MRLEEIVLITLLVLLTVAIEVAIAIVKRIKRKRKTLLRLRLASAVSTTLAYMACEVFGANQIFSAVWCLFVANNWINLIMFCTYPPEKDDIES